MNKSNIKLIRRPKVLECIPISKSTLQNWINEGKFPSPIKLSLRSVAFIDIEVNQIAEALIMGFNSDQLKELVKKIHLERNLYFVS